MQSHWNVIPSFYEWSRQFMSANIDRFNFLNVNFVRWMHSKATGNMLIFYLVCSLILVFDRMSSNAGSTAGGMCRAHQGAEEWGGASGLQNKRWHYCPTQGCAQQEPHSAYSEYNMHSLAVTHTHTHNRSRKLTPLFVFLLLLQLPACKLSLWEGRVCR